MLVDSYRFLPRSFVAMYESATPLPDETEPVWTSFPVRLAEASITIVTSAGLSIADEQEPFDVERERQEPTWGDPTHRVIPHLCRQPLAMNHLHVNNADVLADRNVALPVDVLDELVHEGRVGAAGPSHVSVMGYQQAGLATWRAQTASAIIEVLRDQSTHGVVFAPV